MTPKSWSLTYLVAQHTVARNSLMLFGPHFTQMPKWEVWTSWLSYGSFLYSMWFKESTVQLARDLIIKIGPVRNQKFLPRVLNKNLSEPSSFPIIWWLQLHLPGSPLLTILLCKRQSVQATIPFPLEELWSSAVCLLQSGSHDIRGPLIQTALPFKKYSLVYLWIKNMWSGVLFYIIRERTCGVIDKIFWGRCS